MTDLNDAATEAAGGEPATPPAAPSEHISERPPSFYTYVREGCRCPDCVAKHRETVGRKPGSSTKKKKQRKGTTAGRITEEIRTEATKGPKPKGKSKAISEDAWIDLTGRALVYLSMFFAMYVLYWTDQRDNDELVDYLAMSDDEAATVGTPFARLLHKSPLNTKYGRDFVEHFDIVASLMAIAMYLRRIAPYAQQSRQFRSNIKKAQKAGVDNPAASVTPIRRPRRQEEPKQNGSGPAGPAAPPPPPGSSDSQAPPATGHPGVFNPGDQYRST